MPVPKFPDFEMSEFYDRGLGVTVTQVLTDTGRPKTPTFMQYHIFSDDLRLSEETKREFCKRKLMHAFNQAHPNGCPGRHEEGVKLNQEPKELPHGLTARLRARTTRRT